MILEKIMSICPELNSKR